MSLGHQYLKFAIFGHGTIETFVKCATHQSEMFEGIRF